MESFALIVKMPFSLSPLLQSSPSHIFAEILPRPAQFHWDAIVLNVKTEAHLEPRRTSTIDFFRKSKMVIAKKKSLKRMQKKKTV